MIKLYSCSSCRTRLCRVVISSYDDYRASLGFDAEEFWNGPPMGCISGKASIQAKWREC